ncbi:MAG: FAD binding domain-containing protein [Ignavibacteriales bacterium]|nr:FAD binding domain-containing protein [Ignavibacteriales bacterium]
MESDINFILNNQEIHTKINPSTVLLDFIRKTQKLTGTKEVCKEGDCGACVVLHGDLEENELKYKTINSCLYPIQKVNGKHIVTIEGLNQENLNIIQKEFVNQGASQCGFCTPGFIVSLTGYLLNTKEYDYDEAVNYIGGNICRCTGYNSIKKSVNNILLDMIYVNCNNNNRLEYYVESNILPNYFADIHEKLKKLKNNIIAEEHTLKSQHSFIIGGGTDLFVQKPDELLNSDVIFNSPQNEKITTINDKVEIHSSATIDEVKEFFEKNIKIFSFSKLFKLFASKPIRNSATIAGNIVNASPIADLTITLLSLNAELTLSNSSKEIRKIKLDQFYSGYKSLNLTNDEIIETISFPIPNKNSLFNFEKVSKRTYLDIASVNSAMLLEADDKKIMGARISAGGVSPIPLFLSKTSEFLLGKEISNEIVKCAVEIAQNEISPISDIRGNKEYKSLLLAQLIKAHFIELFPEIVNHEVLV